MTFLFYHEVIKKLLEEYQGGNLVNKADYFRELAYRLRGLPERERQNILQVYEELFQKAIENGKNEEEIAESLGYPRIPNWEASTNVHVQPPVHSYQQVNHVQAPYAYPAKSESGIKKLVIAIALAFFNLTFILGPFFGICGAFIGLYASSFALLVSPLLLLAGNNWGFESGDLLFNIFAMLAAFGLGILLSMATIALTKLFFRLTRAYVRFNVKLIKGA